jgi:hypothetical protein
VNDITTQWLIPIATNLIAATVIWSIATMLSRTRASIIKVKGVAIAVTKRIFPTVFNASVYLAALYFSISRLVFLVSQDGPVVRVDVLLISFFTAFFTVTIVAIALGAEIWPTAKAEKSVAAI